MSTANKMEFSSNAFFEKIAASYEKSGGDLTRRISAHLISISSPPLSPSSVVLDNACGPGITCTEILKQVPKEQWPASIHATDFSPAMIKELGKKGHTEIQSQVMDAQDLKFPNEYFSHVYFAFAIFALPDATKGAKELYRTLQPGGVAYVTTWVVVGWTPIVARAIHAVRPDAPLYKNPLPEEWFKAEKLKDVLVSGGFEETKIDVERFDESMGSEGFDGLLEFVKSGVLASVTGGWSEEERGRLNEELVGEIEKLRSSGDRIPMPAWIGVARK
jgi:ubiquinone/menaquinone biosynthesis C-methylase UbiE